MIRFQSAAARLAATIAMAMLAAACTTGGGSSSLPSTTSSESTPTIIDPVATTTTSARAMASLPEVRGVIETPTGILVAITGTTGGGWTVLSPCGNEVEITEGRRIGRQQVVIDPGHGGEEPGAVGELGLLESDLNLAVARDVSQSLRDDGFSVLLTRDSDVRLTLTARSAIAAAVGAEAFVSIHHNAAPDGPSVGPGTEVWYQFNDRRSRRLSGLIHEGVVAALSRFEADWVADSDAGVKYRLNSRGTDYYGILRESAGIPAALAELAFLSNPSEERLLSTSAVQRAEAAAVAGGIERFLTSDAEGSGFVDAYERSAPAGSGGGAKGCVDPPLG